MITTSIVLVSNTFTSIKHILIGLYAYIHCYRMVWSTYLLSNLLNSVITMSCKVFPICLNWFKTATIMEPFSSNSEQIKRAWNGIIKIWRQNGIIIMHKWIAACKHMWKKHWCKNLCTKKKKLTRSWIIIMLRQNGLCVSWEALLYYVDNIIQLYIVGKLVVS